VPAEVEDYIVGLPVNPDSKQGCHECDPESCDATEEQKHQDESRKIVTLGHAVRAILSHITPHGAPHRPA
jgi:hypothetical protein